MVPSFELSALTNDRLEANVNSVVDDARVQVAVVFHTNIVASITQLLPMFSEWGKASSGTKSAHSKTQFSPIDVFLPMRTAWLSPLIVVPNEM